MVSLGFETAVSKGDVRHSVERASRRFEVG